MIISNVGDKKHRAIFTKLLFSVTYAQMSDYKCLGFL